MIDALSIVAQVAVGLAGFGGVAVVLGRGPGRWTAVDAVRIRGLLYAAFGALFASLVAVGVSIAGGTEELATRCGAGMVMVVIVLWAGTIGREIPRLDAASRSVFDPRVAVVIMAALALGVVAQLVTVAGFAGRFGSALFFLGLVALLGYAAFGFIRLLFRRPLDE